MATSVSGSTNTAPLSSPGVGSGLDINALVGKLMAVEQQPLAALARQQAQANATLSAVGTLKGALAALQGAAEGLDNPDRFRAMSASVSDAAALDASVSSGAVAGSYAIEVSALAQQQKLHSASFAASSTTVGTGTLTFQFGTYASGANSFTLNGAKSAQTVTIGAGQNTLAGIRDAVNAARIGVSATIVNDGSGARLVFTSQDSGVANGIKLTVADADGNHTDASGLSQLAYDPTAAAGAGKNLSETQAARDASLKIDGIAVTRASNTIADAVDGLTLTLKAITSAPATLSISRDTNGAKGAVQGFIKAYNDAVSTIARLTAYDAKTKQVGPLQGDYLGRAAQSQLSAPLNAAIAGAPAGLATLAQLGVARQKDGTLALNDAKFSAAAGSNFDAIAGLFARLGRPSDLRVGYTGAGDKTQPGSYAIAVTQAATHGTLSGSQAANLTIAAGANDALSLSVDGNAVSVTLAAGTYATAADLALEVQTKLNGALAASGASVSVSASGGVLSLASQSYGSVSALTGLGGNAAANLLGAAPSATAGVDIAGSINGVAATGSGQFLTGTAGDASEGLRVKVESASAGSFGSVDYSIGYAHQLSSALGKWLDTGGSVEGRVDGLNAQLKRMDQRSQELQTRLVQIEARYRKQFTALDVMLSSMQNTSTYLTQQLASLQNLKA